MASVSQTGRQKAKPFTVQDQITAEVAAACGVGIREIGRIVGWTHTRVRTHLLPTVAEKKRVAQRAYYAQNADACRQFARRYYRLNIEYRRKQDRLYYARNAEKCRQYKRQKRLENPTENRERCRRYYEANRDRMRECCRRYREVNPEKHREYCRQWRKVNLDKERQASRRRSAWKRAARRRALHPVTQQQIDARFALWSNRCAFCGVDAGHERNRRYERLTVEHVLALTKGGLDEASNTIPACSTCNTSKKASPVEAWYRRQPWFTDQRWRKIKRHCPAAVVGQLPLALAA
jgi:hypothetical protein